jgi:hypothetical protein
MNLTLNQIFARYPLSIRGIAARVGKSREWLSALAYGRILKSEAEKKSALLKIEAEIHALGQELQEIKIIENEN